ncbi:hypothetical protein Adt_30941 [Abeliophyllum distichum]|uniref:Uncharacterized protein n=1 Tax=Abeliophyllum distichum TaxID=126358 RepID=A0ABD1RCP7_9LAMI
MYQAVIFTLRKMKDEGMVENKKVVGKRLRISSAYLSSPFTAGVKRRNIIDGSKIDLFQKMLEMIGIHDEVDMDNWGSLYVVSTDTEDNSDTRLGRYGQSGYLSIAEC